MPDRYVQLPNGSYLHWPEGVSAATFKAKATKLMGPQVPTEQPNRVNESMGKITGISAYHPKTGLAGIEEKMANWQQQLSEFAGRGTSKAMGDLVASPGLGTMRVGQGLSEIPQGKVWKGTKDIVGGGLEASKLPGLFLMPEGMGVAKGLLPSTEKGAELFEQVAHAANHVPVNLAKAGNEALDIKEFTSAGGTTPKVINDFIKRVTQPGAPPLTYREARMFYENAGTKLATDMKGFPVKGRTKYLLGKFQKALGEANREAAETVGHGKTYDQAMQTYRRGAQIRDLGKNIKTNVVPAAVKGAAGVAGAGGAYELYRMLGGGK